MDELFLGNNESGKKERKNTLRIFEPNSHSYIFILFLRIAKESAHSCLRNAIT